MSDLILFLAANPTNETRLRVGHEATRIKEAIDASTHRAHFAVREEHAVRLDSLQRLILKHHPTIVHISGHGSEAGELIFEDQNGTSIAADPDAIAELFRLAGPSVRLVILNACFSRPQANAIAQYVNAVVGMSVDIPDETAIAFSKSLYENLGEGCDVNRAYELAKNYLRLLKMVGAEIPDLIEGARLGP